MNGCKLNFTVYVHASPVHVPSLGTYPWLAGINAGVVHNRGDVLIPVPNLGRTRAPHGGQHYRVKLFHLDAIGTRASSG